MKENERRQQLEGIAEKVLREVGIKTGHKILDFGCGSGTYTIPAARIVGAAGKVYALDKNSKKLDELMQKAESAGLGNIKRMETLGELKLWLREGAIDIVLLYDIFHEYYFPRANDRRRLLLEIYRVLKPNGFLSVWPKHMESKAEEEIETANFYLESKYLGAVIHDGRDFEKGEILNFKKKKGDGKQG